MAQARLPDRISRHPDLLRERYSHRTQHRVSLPLLDPLHAEVQLLLFGDCADRQVVGERLHRLQQSFLLEQMVEGLPPVTIFGRGNAARTHIAERILVGTRHRFGHVDTGHLTGQFLRSFLGQWDNGDRPVSAVAYLRRDSGSAIGGPGTSVRADFPALRIAARLPSPSSRDRISRPLHSAVRRRRRNSRGVFPVSGLERRGEPGLCESGACGDLCDRHRLRTSAFQQVTSDTQGCLPAHIAIGGARLLQRDSQLPGRPTERMRDRG
ncbi:hypothetical protein DFR68_102636 [Nocardia mexicana]|uniref:Uncharacterized protein n=1 Tax=Nocardia mexicana TaxID=279262 RepID=A0A370HC57_9NOCA|nr:hypothetical protein DFR68_102636 [Nocardia mexicana]